LVNAIADLPIAPLLPELARMVAEAGRVVLQAPPGAGKTTGAPLALLDAVDGRIVMLEPRRVAARAAAERLAESLGETVGRGVGYRIRGETRPGSRIEVVTEGVLTRMLQAAPDLPGVGCLIFDEFHERALNADLGLALALEARAALRPDLRLLVMSATLDAGPIAALMDEAPVLTAEGRAHPVETRWLDRPRPPGDRLARPRSPAPRRRWRRACPRASCRSCCTAACRSPRSAPRWRHLPAAASWCWRRRSPRPR
jgi:ATP-dependent helicase HrpB